LSPRERCDSWGAECGYEALLCFRGFFAQNDLYEVKPADKNEPNALEVGYFVSAEDWEKYKEEERVYDDNGKPKCYINPCAK
jgi:hypothetical protein